MPELPEVETVRRSLGPLLGRRVRAVRVSRPEVITGPATPEALLEGTVVAEIARRGKHLHLAGAAVLPLPPAPPEWGERAGVRELSPLAPGSAGERAGVRGANAAGMRGHGFAGKEPSRPTPHPALPGGEGAQALAASCQWHPTSSHGHPSAPAVAVHLGMTGSLRLMDHLDRTPVAGRTPPDPWAEGSTGGLPSLAWMRASHTHVIWALEGGGWLFFRDPRRFGGLWTFPDVQACRAARWANLGEDALTIGPAALHRALQGTRRGLKVALLDQRVLAGLGNIYVDELLFRLGLHPQTPADRLDRPAVARLVRQMRRLLAQAIEGGGSTVRTYANGQGQAGRFQLVHQVYGRAGRPCRRCAATLTSEQVAGRTTVWCPLCQKG